jgi:hypothetical protein
MSCQMWNWQRGAYRGLWNKCYKWTLSPLNGSLHTRYSGMIPRCKHQPRKVY